MALLVGTSSAAVLLMAGLLLFFYRWVVRPLRILLRSMVGPLELHRPAALVVAAAQLLLLEFTCTLLVGPPTILTTVLPLC